MAIINTFTCAKRLAGRLGIESVPGLCPRRTCSDHYRLAAARSTPAKIAFRKGTIGDTSGAAAVEFALIVPVLMLVMFGTFVFGIALNNYVTLTHAVQAGALQFAVSRGGSTPWTDTRNAIFQATPNPTQWQNSLTITLSVNGTACGSDSACQTALAANAGKSASVQATFPYTLIVLGHNYSKSPTLKVKTTERIR